VKFEPTVTLGELVLILALLIAYQKVRTATFSVGGTQISIGG